MLKNFLGCLTVLGFCLSGSILSSQCDGGGEIFDSLKSGGSASAVVKGGLFSPEGWRPQGGSLIYNFERSISGSISFKVRGLTANGVSEHDYVEMFSSHNGHINDGKTDWFLLFKMAGSVYPDFSGKMKIEMGLENDDKEWGQFGDKLAWDPNRLYEFTVTWGNKHARAYRDGVKILDVNYSNMNNGVFPVRTIRLPNNGNYNNSPAQNQIVYSDVRITGIEGVDETPPVINNYAVSSLKITSPGNLRFDWSVSDNAAEVLLCARDQATMAVFCDNLPANSGNLTIPIAAGFSGIFDTAVVASTSGGCQAISTIMVIDISSGTDNSGGDGGDGGGGDGDGGDGGGDGSGDSLVFDNFTVSPTLVPLNSFIVVNWQVSGGNVNQVKLCAKDLDDNVLGCDAIGTDAQGNFVSFIGSDTTKGIFYLSLVAANATASAESQPIVVQIF